MTVSPKTRQELTALLMQIANPESVKFKPDLSDSNYKFLVRANGTYKVKVVKRQYTSLNI